MAVTGYQRVTFVLPAEVEAAFQRTRGRRRRCSREDFLSGYLAALEDREQILKDLIKRLERETAQANP